jgi:hypothetical protein
MRRLFAWLWDLIVTAYAIFDSRQNLDKWKERLQLRVKVDAIPLPSSSSLSCMTSFNQHRLGKYTFLESENSKALGCSFLIRCFGSFSQADWSAPRGRRKKTHLSGLRSKCIGTSYFIAAAGQFIAMNCPQSLLLLPEISLDPSTPAKSQLLLPILITSAYAGSKCTSRHYEFFNCVGF